MQIATSSSPIAESPPSCKGSLHNKYVQRQPSEILTRHLQHQIPQAASLDRKHSSIESNSNVHLGVIADVSEQCLLQVPSLTSALKSSTEARDLISSPLVSIYPDDSLFDNVAETCKALGPTFEPKYPIRERTIDLCKQRLSSSNSNNSFPLAVDIVSNLSSTSLVTRDDPTQAKNFSSG
ncbi:unnamed protein product [Protopolystoma xenopodis]|uniref:Uncharacterized protein n=1 Tax=Protopolystoma xenopodis TaxID=117903 RepID=A0A3S5AII1_9PLAT|nr:unnamed protein product [Protopolystoma xenopodis]